MAVVEFGFLKATRVAVKRAKRDLEEASFDDVALTILSEVLTLVLSPLCCARDPHSYTLMPLGFVFGGGASLDRREAPWLPRPREWAGARLRTIRVLPTHAARWRQRGAL